MRRWPFVYYTNYTQVRPFTRKGENAEQPFANVFIGAKHCTAFIGTAKSNMSRLFREVAAAVYGKNNAIFINLGLEDHSFSPGV